MTPMLWHYRFGFLVMRDSDENQWTAHLSGGPTRYGEFQTDYMGTVINLPMEEVMITFI